MVVVESISEWLPGSLSVFTLIIASFIAIVVGLVKRYKFVQVVEKVPGPPARIPIIGNALDIQVEPHELFELVIGLSEVWRQSPVIRVWAGPFPMFLIHDADAAEVLLSSNKLIEKSREYEFLHPWLNTGLLTSTGAKWHSRRKMLTPAFHFKILEDFVEVFNEQSRVLVDILGKHVRADGRQGFNIFPYITRATLDIICDTAMGRHVNAQFDYESEYVRAVYRMSHIAQKRQATPWMQPDWLFKWSVLSKDQEYCLKILHDFTDKVIAERKAEHQKLDKRSTKEKDEDDDAFSKKQRLAFLDLLISASNEGKALTDRDIREEVDTFMFEGHDTTAAAISWSIHLIGSHPKVQELVHEELNRVFGDSDRSITMSDLAELKYLECCIKEALRLYPSVPMMGRKLSEDTNFKGSLVPKGTTTLLLTYSLHRDPKHFPDPELYQPERFFPENARGRHPYAYVPFSAGPRNCIGQKFALMEEKVVLASIFRNFFVKALDVRDEIALLGELILRPRDGISVQLIPKTAA